MDVIDTRDLVKELSELEDAIARGEEDPESLDGTEAERAASIRKLFEDVSGRAGDKPEDGITLIAEGDFEDYARELAEDIGAIKSDAGWPYDHIDWAAAAAALSMDYTTVDFDGTTYYYR